jgi:hypothetical protein
MKAPFHIRINCGDFWKKIEFFFKKQQGILQENILEKNMFRKMAKIRHKTKSLNKTPRPLLFFLSPQKEISGHPPFFGRQIARNVAPK